MWEELTLVMRGPGEVADSTAMNHLGPRPGPHDAFPGHRPAGLDRFQGSSPRGP